VNCIECLRYFHYVSILDILVIVARSRSTILLLVGLTFFSSAPRLGAQVERPASSARVVLQLDSTVTAQFDARGFDLGVTQLAGVNGLAPGTSSAEITLVKQAGPYTGDLVGLSASGAHAPSATIEVLDSLGVPTLTIHLTDVAVMSDHIALSSAREALAQQSISQEETLTQLAADYQQAQRDLATAEELGKSHVTTRQDLARARSRTAELQQRVALATERQTMLVRQLRRQGELDESVVIHFARMELDTQGDGGHGAWDSTKGAAAAEHAPRKPPTGRRLPSLRDPSPERY
jgi:hypothetical protein